VHWWRTREAALGHDTADLQNPFVLNSIRFAYCTIFARAKHRYVLGLSEIPGNHCDFLRLSPDFKYRYKFGNVWDRLIRILWEELQALKHVVAGTVDSQEGSELLM